MENRELRSFLCSRDPSIDRMCRPKPSENQKRCLFETGINEEDESDMDFYENASNTNDENYDPSVESSNSESQTDVLSKDCASIYLRFRPVSEQSAFCARNNVLIVAPSSESSSTSNNKNVMEKQYIFTDIFDRHIKQKNVYENCVRSKIHAEDSFTLLTYGTSGSGKTYTLLGTEYEPGIIPRSLEQIFHMYKNKVYPTPLVKLVNGHIQVIGDDHVYPDKQLRTILLKDCPPNGETIDTTRLIIGQEHNFDVENNEEASVFIWVSFIEIYNENVYDLLEIPEQSATKAPPTRRCLKIIGNDGNVFVKNLNTVYIKNSAEANYLLKSGLQRVNYAATSINSNSSRSHCIFTVDVIKFYRNTEYTHSSYRFCDLAGSERLHKTQNVGTRLKEAQSINTSLSVLGRCLDAANSNSTLKKKKFDIIPYRESKLTMLLQAALLGKEKLCMIVNIMPIDKFYEENINVLGFASIAKNIVFKQVPKPLKTRYSVLANGIEARNMELLEENIFLRSEVHRLNKLYEDLKIDCSKMEQDLRDELSETYQELSQKQLQLAENKHKREIDILKRTRQQDLDSLKQKYEYEIEDLQDELHEAKELIKKLQKLQKPSTDAIEIADDDSDVEDKRDDNDSSREQKNDSNCEQQTEHIPEKETHDECNNELAEKTHDASIKRINESSSELNMSLEKRPRHSNDS